MNKCYDEIRFFFFAIVSYFHYTRSIFSILFKWYWADIIITTYRRISVSYKQQANIRRSCLVFTRRISFHPQVIIYIFPSQFLQLCSLFMLISQHSSVILTFVLLQKNCACNISKWKVQIRKWSRTCDMLGWLVNCKPKGLEKV